MSIQINSHIFHRTEELGFFLHFVHNTSLPEGNRERLLCSSKVWMDGTLQTVNPETKRYRDVNSEKSIVGNAKVN